MTCHVSSQRASGSYTAAPLFLHRKHVFSKPEVRFSMTCAFGACVNTDFDTECF